MKIVLQDDEQLQKRLEEFPDRIMENIGAAATKDTQQMAEEIKSNLSGGVLKTRTGNLLDSLGLIPPEIDALHVEVGIHAADGYAYYGRILDVGGEHEYMEYPKNAKAIAFEADGQLFFTYSVHHPETPEMPWFSYVLPEHENQIIKDMMDAARQAL